MNQHGVAARDQQRQERERRRLVLQHRRQQMALHVVNRHDRAIPGQSQAGGHAAPDHQRSHEPGSCRVGDHVRPLDAGLVEYRLHQRQQHADVIARGNLRHHAAIDGVRVDLAVKRVRHQALARAVQRDPGLVTAGFYSQNVHTRRIIPFLGCRTLCNCGIRRYYRELSPGHAPGLFMSDRNT